MSSQARSAWNARSAHFSALGGTPPERLPLRRPSAPRTRAPERAYVAAEHRPDLLLIDPRHLWVRLEEGLRLSTLYVP